MADEDARQAEIRERMSENRDPRALRTRSKLVAAYRDLLADSSTAQVTVAQIVGRAKVNRTSFYSHFADTDALAIAALTEVFDIVASADSASRVSRGESLKVVSEHSLADVIGFVANRRHIYAELLVRNNDFASAVEDAFMESSLATLQAHSGNGTADPVITARFIAAGVMGVISWWLRDDGDWTAEQLAAQLAKIIPTDFTSE